MKDERLSLHQSFNEVQDKTKEIAKKLELFPEDLSMIGV